MSKIAERYVCEKCMFKEIQKEYTYCESCCHCYASKTNNAEKSYVETTSHYDYLPYIFLKKILVCEMCGHQEKESAMTRKEIGFYDFKRLSPDEFLKIYDMLYTPKGDKNDDN